MNAEAFRECVRSYLRTGGYTQEELAGAVHLNPKVLSRKLNGNANAYLTRREVRDIIVTLADWHLITTQEEVLKLLALAEIDPAILRDEEWQSPLLTTLPHAHPEQTVQKPQHNLPALRTRLIGRDWALERLQQLLASQEVHLVTLVGPGGSGKTQLALHVATRLASFFADGAWFVPLASISDPALVPLSIMQTLNITYAPGLAPLQSLLRYLLDKQLLLILDNFEHLGEAKTVISSILAEAPRLKLLVTSRVVQHLYGEREFRVPPLDIPDLSVKLRTEQLAQFGAIQLFLERMQAVAPDFTLTDENAEIIAQICARVDGLPLALELAAARVKLLPPAHLLERLEPASLPILTKGAKDLPSRQQTLSNTIQWSYDLLSAREQRWFRRLGIFSGNWSLEAITAMMQELATSDEETPDALDLLEELVDNSLIVRMPPRQEQLRFRMLSTLREYAQEKLRELGEYEHVRDWHACYYLSKAEKAELDLRGPRQARSLELLNVNHNNFRSALAWLLQKAREGSPIHTFSPVAYREVAGGENRTHASPNALASEQSAIEICLRLAAALRPCWEWQGYLIEGRYWLNAVLQIPLAQGAAPSVLAARARALSEAARLVFLQNEKEQALALIEESLALWRQLDDPRGLAMALLHRGWVAHGMDEYEVAKQIYQQGLELISPEEDTWLYAQLLEQLGAAAGFTSDYELSDVCYERSRELSERIGDRSAVADAWKDQGGILLLRTQWARALDYLLKSIRISQEIGHRQYLATALGLVSFAIGLREEPDPETASLYSAQIRGATDRLMEEIGLNPWTRTSPFIQMVRQLIRSRVDDQRWEAAWQAGYALTLEEAIELVYRLGQGTAPQ